MKNKSYFEQQEAIIDTYDEELAARTGAKLFVHSRPFNPHLVTDSQSLEEFLADTASRIQQAERRKRRSAAANDAFMAALRALILDLFAAWMMDPALQVGVNLGEYRYGGNRTRYCNGQLTYRQFKAVFAGLQRLGYLQIDKNGWHDATSGDGASTKVRATQALIDALHGAARLTDCQLNRSPNAEIILLRDAKADGEAPQIEYEDTIETPEMRERLRYINRVNAEHALGLSISRNELKATMNRDDPGDDHQLIDFSARSLCRIFNDGQFNRGGRFYGGWWQGIPKQYRRYITIDDEPTVEADYSTIHARLLYAREGMDCPKDPYDVGLHAQFREWVKRAFNTLLNATGKRIDQPLGYHPDVVGLEYRDLLELVRQRHKPISQYFNTGIGLELQFIDSCIAEQVMMAFARHGLACLPIHDSFLVQQRFRDDLIGVMLTAYETVMARSLRPFMLEEVIHISVPTNKESANEIEVFELYRCNI